MVSTKSIDVEAMDVEGGRAQFISAFTQHGAHGTRESVTEVFSIDPPAIREAMER